MAKSKLEYWSGSAWVQAKTIDFGQGTQNALLNLDIEDKLNSPMKANITLTNAARNPFKVVNDDDDADRYGPLTSVFTDFMPIRIIETSTNVVLFSGKIYDIKNTYDKQYGNVVKLYARDNLAEIADYPTDDKTSPINMTTSQRRSDLIQLIIRDAASDPLNASLNISSDNIYYGDAAKFTASARTFDEADSYTISGLSRQGLKAIYEIANNDPHEASGEIANFGYDYYVDSKYTTTASHTAAADFNYFKRGTRTPFQSTVANFKGAWVEYPIATNFTTTGLKQLMFPDYDFNLPKRDLYTGATAAISRNLKAGATDEEGTNSVNFNLEMELLEGTIAGSNSGAFQWKNKKLVRLGDNVSADSAFAEVLTFGSDPALPVGRVQYQSATSGTGYIVISFEPDVLTNTTISTQKKNFNALSGSAILLTGADTGATFTFNTTSGRPSKALGLSRPLRISGSDSKHINSMRRRVASALSRSKTTRTNCTLRVLPPPFNYVDSTVASVTSSTQIVLDTNVFDYGLRVGMTIAKIDANGTQTAYGYVSAINGSTTVTATLNTGSWTTGGNYSGSVRVYIPIRASHYIYAKNLLANFAGYMFLSTVVYTEGIGAQVTQYKGTGVNTIGTTIGLGIDPNAIQSSIESEGKKYPRDVNVPMGGLGWTYRPIDSTNTAAFSPVDRDTISWTGGEFVIGEMKRFKIRAGNSPDLSTSLDSDTGYPYIYKVFFDPDQSPDGSGTYTFSFIKEDVYYPDMDHVMMAVARAAKLSSGRAIIIFDGTGAGMFGGIDAAGEDQFSAALFKKSLQPYTTDISLFPGKHTSSTVYSTGTASQSGTTVTGSGTTWTSGMIGEGFRFDGGGGGGTITARASNTSITVSNSATVSSGTYSISITATPDNLQRYIHATAVHIKGTAVNGTISFADNTTIAIEYNNSLDLGTVDNTVYYIYFKLVNSGNTETSDFTDVDAAEIERTTTYSDATSDSRGLLAICSTGDVSESDEIAIQAFHGKGQNITADVIAANAIVADAIKAGTVTTKMTSDMTGVTMNTAGQIFTGTKTYSSAEAGWILEYNAGTPRFEIGETDGNYLQWSGSALNIKGSIVLHGSSTNLTETNTLNSETLWSQILGTTNAPDSNATVGAVFGTNLYSSGTTNFTAAELKNANQAWGDVVSGGGKPSDDATVGAVFGTNLYSSGTTNFTAAELKNESQDWDDIETTNMPTPLTLETGGTAALPTFTGTACLLDNRGVIGFSSNVIQFYIRADTGKAYFGGGQITLDAVGLTVGTAGVIKSTGKDSAADSTGGFFLGHDGGSSYDFGVGNDTQYILWDGSAGNLTIGGGVTISGTTLTDIRSKANSATQVGDHAGIQSAAVSTALAGDHTGTLNGLDVNNTTGSRIQFSSGGIIGYTTGSTKSFELSADPATTPFRVFGTYTGELSGDTQTATDPNRGIEFLSTISGTTYLASISGTGTASQIRYDASSHSFMNFHQSGYVQDIYYLTMDSSESADVRIDGGDNALYIFNDNDATSSIQLQAEGETADVDIISDDGRVRLHASNQSTSDTLDPVEISHAGAIIAEFRRQRSYGTDYHHLEMHGHIIPSSDSTYDIGLSASHRFKHGYFDDTTVGDIILDNTNSGEPNDIDGTRGHWVIQEGETDVYIKNELTGKKYRFKLEEV